MKPVTLVHFCWYRLGNSHVDAKPAPTLVEDMAELAIYWREELNKSRAIDATIKLEGFAPIRVKFTELCQTVAVLEFPSHYAEQPVPDDRRTAPVLDDAAAAELAVLGRRIAAEYGRPMDVEWARSGAGFAIVQARPVTGRACRMNSSASVRHHSMSTGCWKTASIRRPSRASRSACALDRLGR